MDISLTRRQIIIISAVVLLLIIVVVILSIFNDNSKLAEEFEPQVYDAANVNSQATTKQAEIASEELSLVMSVARNFTARYLSYSNENWGDNISVLTSQMTEGMLQRAQQDLIGLQNEYSAEEFYGVSAKVLSQDVISGGDNDYSLLLSVQLQKNIGNNEEVDYIKYGIDLVGSGNSWLVDNLYLYE